ncbi:hypothetical protein Mapa_008852 [Marchantia paleacea]|nr:hypothetical protein Mapa_008852 [Marchantia paleacea]
MNGQRRNGDARLTEERYAPIVYEVVIKDILRFVVMQSEFPPLIGVIVVLQQGMFSKAEHTYSIADSQGDHNGLKARRIVEIEAVMGTLPIFKWLPASFHKVFYRVPFDNSSTEIVQTAIRDEQRCFMGIAAQCYVHQMRSLTDVENDGHILSVWMTSTMVSS